MGLLADPGQRPVLPSAAATTEPLDESGTAPGDRSFRPDVEGLRAVAILLVVLYHAGVPGISGGYVGVDVFFVISGFVITGVLLRERTSTGRTSLAHFYARRSRRILPAATLVIIVTVVAAYGVVGVLAGNRTAIDSRWAEVFLANFHFASTGTNYLNAHQLPSPLQNFWSLAIEEQFYLVYPSFFLVLWSLQSRMAARTRLLLGLGAVVIASFLWSVLQTSSHPATAYFSPLTRAWELALGAMVALAANRLVRLPQLAATALTWVGLAGIVYAAVAFDANTAYPGSAVAIPVVGTALVIAGGTPVPAMGAEILLGRGPFGWLGRLSYSLYLWHWPVLILAAEASNQASLPFHRNIVPLVVALVASVVTYYLYENPVRHLRPLRRSRDALALGAALVCFGLLLSSIALWAYSSPAPAAGGPLVIGTPAQVTKAVRAAPHIRRLPTDLAPPLTGSQTDWGGPSGACFPSAADATIPLRCMTGYPHGPRTMVLYGDSHAGMWSDSFSLIAGIEGWRFLDMGKGWCPAADLPYQNPPGLGRTDGEFAVCDAFHRNSVNLINELQPDLVVLTEEYRTRPNGRLYTAGQWRDGLERTIESLHVPRQDIVVLGNIPVMSQDPPQCLVQSSNDVQACSSRVPSLEVTYNRAEEQAAAATGARYVSTLQWFCSTTCSPVIGRFQVYFDAYHVTGEYATYLSAVMTRALGIEPTWKNWPPSGQTTVPSTAPPASTAPSARSG